MTLAATAKCQRQSITTVKRGHVKDFTVAEHNDKDNKSDNPVKQIAESDEGNKNINESGGNVEKDELKEGSDETNDEL
jgi:hypothetical protein